MVTLVAGLVGSICHPELRDNTYRPISVMPPLTTYASRKLPQPVKLYQSLINLGVYAGMATVAVSVLSRPDWSQWNDEF